MAEPDFDQLVFDESDVRPPGGLRNKVPCYDLALYRAVGGGNKQGVLVVTLNVQMLFNTGVSKMGKTVGLPLKWNETEKQDFADEVRSLWEHNWSRKHRLQTADAAMTEIEVVFDTPITIDGISVGEHWELNVVQIDNDRTATETSSIAVNKGRGHLDSRDVFFKKSMPQRGCVHEFGHMIGLRDEYVNSSSGVAEDNPHFLTDKDSVMNNGEVIRDRHYAMFAHWVSKMWTRELIKFTSKSVVYRVNGTVELSNANL